MILAALLLGLSAGALAANPFSQPGAKGVGEGMRAVPGTIVGNKARLEGGALRLEAEPGKTVSVCTDALIPAAGRMMVEGQWKAEGITTGQAWEGARVKLYFFDAAEQRIKGEKYQPQLAFVRGDLDWKRFDQALVVPEGVASARLCVEQVNSLTGVVWLKDLALVPMTASASASASTAAAPQKNVLFILVDTLRADALGTYGAPAPVSPNLDRLARESLVFDHAWTQYTWTVPSVISFFTSQFARTHGWNSSFDKVAAGEYTAMGEEVPTLAEVLKAQGYITAGHYANGLLKSGIGVGRGFLTWKHGNDEEVVKRSIDDIKLWNGDGGPNLLYVHLMTPHIPLRPSSAAQKAAGVELKVPAEGIRYWEGEAKNMPQEEYNRLFQQAYTAAVFDADRYVQQVLTALEQAGHKEDTLVVVTADHGELTGEHGLLGHGSYVYEGLTRVPLIVRAPGRAPARVSDRIGRTIDIAPTVLEWAGLSKAQPKGWQGLSLFASSPGLVAVSERDHMAAFMPDGRYKIVENRESNALLRAYDLKTDPGEANAQTDASLGWVASLRKTAEKWRSTAPLPGQQAIQQRKVVSKTDKEKQEELEMLRALGYIE